MNRLKSFLVVQAFLLLFFALVDAQTPDDETGSSCIEIQKAHPTSEKSALTKGEG